MARPGILSPCRKSVRRGDVTTYCGSLIVSARSQDTNAFGYVIRVGLWPFSTNHHAGISMGTLRRMYQPKLSRRQRLSGARRVGLGMTALVLRGLGLLTVRVRNVQECKGRWAQDPCALRI